MKALVCRWDLAILHSPPCSQIDSCPECVGSQDGRRAHLCVLGDCNCDSPGPFSVSIDPTRTSRHLRTRLAPAVCTPQLALSMQAQARRACAVPVGFRPLPTRKCCKPSVLLTRPAPRSDHARVTAARPLSLVATTAAEAGATDFSALVSANLPAIIACTVAALILIWIAKSFSTGSRKYEGNVGDEYDAWTKEGILEYYWGEHIHLGYYNENERGAGDKRWQAKKDFKQVRSRSGGSHASMHPVCSSHCKTPAALECRGVQHLEALVAQACMAGLGQQIMLDGSSCRPCVAGVPTAPQPAPAAAWGMY